MRKLVILILSTVSMFFIFLINGHAQNDSFFGAGNKTSKSPTAAGTTAAPPPASQVMPSEDFSKLVNKMNTENKSQLKQQVADDLAKNPPTAPGGENNAGTSSETSSSSSSYSSQSATSSGTTATPSSSSNTMATPAPQSTINKPSSSGGYTGFGTGNTTTAPSTTNQSSGWGIKY